MDAKNFFTDEKGIFKFEQFEQIAVLKNFETGEIIRVPWPQDGRIIGFRRIELRQEGSQNKSIITPPEGNPPADNIAKKSRKAIRTRSSKYYGVSLHKKSGKWRVQIPIQGSHGQSIWGGLFGSEEEAAKKADEMVQQRGIKDVKKTFQTPNPND